METRFHSLLTKALGYERSLSCYHIIWDAARLLLVHYPLFRIGFRLSCLGWVSEGLPSTGSQLHANYLMESLHQMNDKSETLGGGLMFVDVKREAEQKSDYLGLAII